MDRSFVAVPIVPTPEMIDAGGAGAELIWAAMLAARPSAIHSIEKSSRQVLEATSARKDGDQLSYALRQLPVIGTTARNPTFWGDLDVRRLVIELHRQVTVEAAREIISRECGVNRTPSKSALARAWKRLDLANPIRRKRIPIS